MGKYVNRILAKKNTMNDIHCYRKYIFSPSRYGFWIILKKQNFEIPLEKYKILVENDLILTRVPKKKTLMKRIHEKCHLILKKSIFVTRLTVIIFKIQIQEYRNVRKYKMLLLKRYLFKRFNDSLKCYLTIQVT